MLHISLLVMNNLTESAIFISFMYSLPPKGSTVQNLSIAKINGPFSVKTRL